MGVAIRHLLIDPNDEVLSLDNRLFDKLWANAPEAVLPQFAGSRIRMVEVAVELHRRRAVAVLRVAYSYAHFDGQGRFDQDKALRGAALKMEAGDILGSLLSRGPKTVIHASPRFAARRRDHEALWEPTPEIERAIYETALGSRRCRRLTLGPQNG